LAAPSFPGGTVSFNRGDFSGGTVGFDGAEFPDVLVRFDTKFTGGTVDFSGPGDWSTPPAFPWTGTPPPGVVLPEKKDQSQV
jgi:hypothetical protein